MMSEAGPDAMNADMVGYHLTVGRGDLARRVVERLVESELIHGTLAGESPEVRRRRGRIDLGGQCGRIGRDHQVFG